MKAGKDIVLVIDTLVSQMTPIVIVDAITLDGDNFKIESCNTFWLTIGKSVTIDSVEYFIVSFVQDQFIIVSGSVEPTASEFQLPAPRFAHGTHRKVNNERPQDATEPWVYLPSTSSKPDNDEDSTLGYTAVIRPIFLMDYDTQRDTTVDQQTDIIRPLIAMVDVFLELINDQHDKFEDPTDYEINQHMSIGTIDKSGNIEKIFNENLSGVQMIMTLEGYEIDDCDCPPEPIKFCADVRSSFNGTDTESTLSGGKKVVIVQTKGGSPVQTGDLILDLPGAMTIEVDAPGLVPLNVGSLLKTGANVSFQDQDDGDKQFGTGVDFFTLDHNNGFGVDATRFTDFVGGQTYTNGVIVDWNTLDQVLGLVLCYFQTLESAAVLTTQISNQPFTKATFSDWFVCNYTQLFNVLNPSIFRSYLNYAPFNHNVLGTATRVWCSTRESATVGITYAGSSFIVAGHTAPSQALTCRVFTLAELGL